MIRHQADQHGLPESGGGFEDSLDYVTVMIGEQMLGSAHVVEHRPEPSPVSGNSGRLPLEGIRVVDFSMGWAGPVCTRTLADLGWARYGPAAKAIQWGIATHQGQEYGPANRWLMLAGCIAIWLLGVSSLVMWWKRRPTRTFSAPPRSSDPRARWAVVATIAPLAVIYPLTGASLLVVLVLDFALRRVRSAQTPREITP